MEPIVSVSFWKKRKKNERFFQRVMYYFELGPNCTIGNVQDGAGRVGKMLFARQGKKFDCDLKQVMVDSSFQKLLR